MYPILARYGSIFIYSYTVLLALGVLAGIGLTAWSNRESLSYEWFDAVLIISIGAIVGGRLGFVMLHWEYYQERVPEIWRFWQGGLSYFPALLAGLSALLFWTAVKKQSFYKLAALLCPAFILVTAFGWGACWLEGCAYGRESVLGALTADLADEFGVYAVRFQSQMIGLLLTLLLLTVAVAIRRRMAPAALFWFTIGAISFINLLTGLVRGDSVPEISGIRLDLIVSGVLLVTSLIMLQFEAVRRRSTAKEVHS